MADYNLPFLAKPASLLPIARHKKSLQYAVETHSVVVIVGETGSGKTTQLPQYLDEAGWTTGGKMIAVTQPRRIAATTIASRVAAEMRCQVGEDVGYSVRFEESISERTRIKFLTDGMLLREALLDPLLTKYSVIMVDEAHERSLSSDILIGLLKKVQKQRPELKIVVSSATIEAEKMADFFRPLDADGETEFCRIIALGGRSYPVDVQHLESPIEDYVQSATDTAISIHKEEAPGDVLIFFTGRDEIQRALELLTDYSRTILPSQQALQPLPLYAGLDQASQMYVFSPAAENTRKVILSTNVAEASVTIDGIVYVIDTGFVKLRTYNPVTNIETLTKTPVSKASATQRAGRAGRTRPGKCYRLYTAAAYQNLPQTTPPEIQRTNLGPVILQLKALGIDNVVQFPYLTPPPAKLMARSLELLYALDALDDYAKLTTPLGTRMAELALPPMMSKALLISTDPIYNCTSEMLTISAMCSIQSTGNANIWFDHDGQRTATELSRRKFAAEQGDHLTYLNVYNAYMTTGKRDQRWCQQHHLNHKALSRAISIRNQLRRMLERFHIQIPNDTFTPPQQSPDTTDITTRILKCLIAGYFVNVAKFNPVNGTYRPLAVSGTNKNDAGTTMHAHPTSLMFNRKAEYVLFNEVLETGEKVYIRDISSVERKWVLEAGKKYYSVKEGR